MVYLFRYGSAAPFAELRARQLGPDGHRLPGDGRIAISTDRKPMSAVDERPAAVEVPIGVGGLSFVQAGSGLSRPSRLPILTFGRQRSDLATSQLDLLFESCRTRVSEPSEQPSHPGTSLRGQGRHDRDLTAVRETPYGGAVGTPFEAGDCVPIWPR